MTLLVIPTRTDLDTYLDALRRGWSPDNSSRASLTAVEHARQIDTDPDAFLAMHDSPRPNDLIILPDGSSAPRLPSIRRWIWSGGFCGTISLRWSLNGPLPDYVLGHIGYSVVPWRRREGHATRALGLMLREAASLGLPWVDVTTDLDNEASQKAILANGGRFSGMIERPASHGGGDIMLYRIDTISR